MNSGFDPNHMNPTLRRWIIFAVVFVFVTLVELFDKLGHLLGN